MRVFFVTLGAFIQHKQLPRVLAVIALLNMRNSTPNIPFIASSLDD